MRTDCLGKEGRVEIKRNSLDILCIEFLLTYYFSGCLRALHVPDHTLYKQCFFFLSYLAAFFFSCLVFLDRSSRATLNRSGEGGRPCPNPDRGEMLLVLSLTMVLQVCFSWMPLIRLREFLSIPRLLSVFIIKGYFCQCFFLHLLRLLRGICLSFS